MPSWLPMRLKSQHWQPEFHSWSPAATCSLWTFMFGENDKQLKAQSYLPTAVEEQRQQEYQCAHV